MDSEEQIKIMSYIKRSKYRGNVLKTMEHELQFPSQIAKKVNLRINQVSTLLKGLKEKGLVECINEEDTMGRFYRLTEKGKEIVKYLLN